MENHGAVTVGASVGEAWVRMYFLDRVCEVQLRAMAVGLSHLRPIPEPVLLHARDQYEQTSQPGLYEWPALRAFAERHLLMSG